MVDAVPVRVQDKWYRLDVFVARLHMLSHPPSADVLVWAAEQAEEVILVPVSGQRHRDRFLVADACSCLQAGQRRRLVGVLGDLVLPLQVVRQLLDATIESERESETEKASINTAAP
eukprot:6207819-Amphidinium_carterae.1